MAVIQSYSGVQALVGRQPTWPTSTSVQTYDGRRQTYARIWETQPNVRTVTGFFSRNIAQLGLHAFERVSDTDRRRITGTELTRVIKRPNPSTTRYRHIEGTVLDYCLYENALWLKVRGRAKKVGLVRVPWCMVEVEGGLLPENYVITGFDGRKKDFAPSEVVHFGGYSPSNPLAGLSRMETLRRVLAEEAAATEHRTYYWRNAGQQQGFFVRPDPTKGAGKWAADQVDDFTAKYAERYSGGKNAGKRPVLPPGMDFKPASFSAKDDGLVETRTLSMVICAAAYFVPPPLVGILDHATFSNVREQHKQLYQDTLGPTLTMLEEDIELQLLPEFEEGDDVYVEFNIAEKLQGSFEEQTQALRTAVGGKPIMTQNEARAKLNLPQSQSEGTDDLDSQVQGAAVPTDGGRPEDPDAVRKQPERNRAEQFSVVLRGLFSRQQQRLAKVAIGERASAFDVRRWTNELAADLAPLGDEAMAWKLAGGVNYETMLLLQAGSDAFTAARADALAERMVSGVV